MLLVAICHHVLFSKAKIRKEAHREFLVIDGNHSTKIFLEGYACLL